MGKKIHSDLFIKKSAAPSFCDSVTFQRLKELSELIGQGGYPQTLDRLKKERKRWKKS